MEESYVFIVTELHDCHRTMAVFDNLVLAIAFSDELPNLYMIERRIVHKVLPEEFDWSR